MSLTPILLVAVIIAVNAGLEVPLGTSGWNGWAVTAAAVGPVLLIVGATWLGMIRCGRRLRKRPGPRPIIAAARLASWARALVILQHAVAVLGLGWMTLIRETVGNTIIVDEMICLLPAVAGFLGIWWAHYPIERRQREAILVRRLEQGDPVYPVPGRVEHVLLQARAGLFLLLVPLLLIVAGGEIVDQVAPDPEWAAGLAKLAITLVIFVAAPLLARVMLHAEPLPGGQVRDELSQIAATHRVRVREILLWHTGGTIINAAVMGLVGPLRYVLLTDVLLESMSADQVRAVMAHEVAHVRRRHMPWLVVCLLACFSVMLLVVDVPREAARSAGWGPEQWPAWVELALAAVQVAGALVLFGWISRRFERQADTFATQHLSEAAGGETVTEESVGSMRGALGRIARLNTMDPRKHSWRHGSIAWRQAYLETLVDRPVASIPIDRVVRRIKLVAGVVLAASLAIEFTVLAIDRPAPVMEEAIAE